MESKGTLKDIARNWETGKFLLTFEMDQDITGQLEDIRGKLLNIVAKQYRKKRSLDANAYYWQLLTKLSEASGISKNRAHNLMLRRYGQLEEMDGHLIYVVVPDDDKVRTGHWRLKLTISSRPRRLRYLPMAPRSVHISCYAVPAPMTPMR